MYAELFNQDAEHECLLASRHKKTLTVCDGLDKLTLKEGFGEIIFSAPVKGSEKQQKRRSNSS